MSRPIRRSAARVSQSLLAPRRRASLVMTQPRLESLEWRELLSLPGAAAVVQDVEPNDTVALAQPLGDVAATPSILVSGWVGNGTAGRSDVDMFQFHLDQPTRIDLSRLAPTASRSVRAVMSLYDHDLSYMDLFNPYGYRLMAQDQDTASGHSAEIVRDLAPGDYVLAVSGAGNTAYSPIIAGSGYAGATGAYSIAFDATPLPSDPSAGPWVVSADPAANAVVASPFVLRVALSSAIDPSTLLADTSVTLTYNPAGTFGDGNDLPVPISSVNFADNIDELQITPGQPLRPGFYRLWLAGDSSVSGLVITDFSGLPLGANADHPTGQDQVIDFQVNGPTGPTDTPATAINLGNLTPARLVQVPGAIGTDPTSDPFSANPGDWPVNNVNLYHFRIHGPGVTPFLAEVFAGRIGSPLDPGLSLYVLDPADHTLHLVAGNNNTLNPTTAVDGSRPLMSDSYLAIPLTAGDYYLGVSSGANTASPSEGLIPGPGSGIYDPNVSHSGQNGDSTGPYLLNLLVAPTPIPASVVSSTPADGAVVADVPSVISVTFNETVNLQNLVFNNDRVSGNGSLPAVYLESTDGSRVYPCLMSYDPTTNTARFEVPARLANGLYELHVSGALGVADLAGHPLVGNDPSGDYVARFTIDAGPSQLTGDPTHGYTATVDAPVETPIDFGEFFPNESDAGVTIDRTHPGNSSASSSVSDVYRFQLMEDGRYQLTLGGAGLPAGSTLKLYNGQGALVFMFGRFDPTRGLTIYTPTLEKGTYELRVGAWSAAAVGNVSYQVRLTLLSHQDNPSPLLDAPTPALQMHVEIGVPGDSGSILVGGMPPGGDGNPGSDSGGVGIVLGGTGGLTMPGYYAFMPMILTSVVTPSSGSAPSLNSAGLWTGTTSGELVAFAVGPVGGVAVAAAPASAEHGESLQVSLPQTLPPIPTAIAMMVTSIQCPDSDPPASEDAEGAPAESAVAVRPDAPEAPRLECITGAVNHAAVAALDPNLGWFLVGPGQRVEPVGLAANELAEDSSTAEHSMSEPAVVPEAVAAMEPGGPIADASEETTESIAPALGRWTVSFLTLGVVGAAAARFKLKGRFATRTPSAQLTSPTQQPRGPLSFRNQPAAARTRRNVRSTPRSSKRAVVFD